MNLKQKTTSFLQFEHWSVHPLIRVPTTWGNKICSCGLRFCSFLIYRLYQGLKKQKHRSSWSLFQLLLIEINNPCQSSYILLVSLLQIRIRYVHYGVDYLTSGCYCSVTSHSWSCQIIVR